MEAVVKVTNYNSPPPNAPCQPKLVKLFTQAHPSEENSWGQLEGKVEWVENRS